MLQISHTCCKHSFNQTHVLVASTNISLSCLEGRIYIITFIIKSIASTRYFIKSITSSRCVADTPRYTPVHTLVHDKYSPACCVSRKLRPKSTTIRCYTADCFKSACLQFVLFKVNVSGSATRLPNCHATDIAPTERLGSNDFFKSSSVINLVYSYKANQTRFECSLSF